ncbi:MAG: hypothetical protein V4605_00640 [Pseudomonadota bacterium]
MFKQHSKHTIYFTNTVQLAKALTVGICLSALNVYADDAHPDIEAKTKAGESVILHANGKWEFVNTQKAAKAKETAIKLDPAANCPPGSQGSFFGFGRCILPGDKDYVTGSRSGKGFGN